MSYPLASLLSLLPKGDDPPAPPPGAPPARPRNPLLAQLDEMEAYLGGGRPLPALPESDPRLVNLRPDMTAEELQTAAEGGGTPIGYYRQPDARPMDLSDLSMARNALIEAEIGARRHEVEQAQKDARDRANIHAFSWLPLAGLQLSGASVDAPNTRDPMLQARSRAGQMEARANGMEGETRARGGYEEVLAQMEEMRRVSGEQRETDRANVRSAADALEGFTEAQRQAIQNALDNEEARTGRRLTAADLLVKLNDEQREAQLHPLKVQAAARTARGGGGRTSRAGRYDGPSPDRLLSRLQSIDDNLRQTDAIGQPIVSGAERRRLMDAREDVLDQYEEASRANPDALPLTPDGEVIPQASLQDLQDAARFLGEGLISEDDYSEIFRLHTGRRPAPAR